jgi:hypothetical protein
MPQVQKILQQETVLATIHGAGSEQVAQLRYLAHIYNAALGASFLVIPCGDLTYLINDGGLRSELARYGAEVNDSALSNAQQWSKQGLVDFLRQMPRQSAELVMHLTNPLSTQSLPRFPASLARTHPQYVKDIVVPTANRSHDVSRLLRSLAASFEFYGYPRDSIRIRIIDTSTSAEQREKTQEVVKRALHQGLAVDYLGPAEIIPELKHIQAQLPPQARKPFATLFMRGLFSANGSTEQPISIGTIRNVTSLLMRDTPHISLDDDMMIHAPLPSATEYQRLGERSARRLPSYDLNADSVNDFARVEERPGQAGRTDFGWVPTDIIGIVNRALDLPLSCSELRQVGAPTLSRFPAGESRQAVVRSYLAGASPDVTTFFKRFIKSGDAGELTGERAPYAVPIEVPASNLHRGYSSGTMFAVTSGLAVPFLDARAYEDVAQTQLAHLICSGDLQHQAGVVEHRRHIGARVVNSDQYIDALLGFHLMSRYISTVRPDSVVMRDPARNQVQLFQSLGKRLWADAQGECISSSDLHTLVDGYQNMARSLRRANIEGADTFLDSRQEIQSAIIQRLRVLQKLNGLLYFYWPVISAAAGQSDPLSGVGG